MPSVVLVTGVSRFLGTHVAARLAASPDIDRIIGVDTVAPRSLGSDLDAPALGRTEFVRADIRNPLIAKVISQARVDTVVHTSPRGRLRAPQLAPRDQHVTGTMQLLAACQTSSTVTRVALASTTAVYGSSARNPAAFVESMPATSAQARGFAREAVEVETYARGFARRRPDIGVTVLRLANVIGPTIDTALTRYLAMPLVPTSLGYDPRLQLLYEEDAVGALVHAALGAHPGIVNVAGEGVVSLSQALRRAGRLRLPVPSPAIALAGALVRNSGVIDVTAEEASFLNYGRVVDTTRLRTRFGYDPEYTTAEALQAYLDARPPPGRPVLSVLAGVQHALDARTARVARAVLPSGVR